MSYSSQPPQPQPNPYYNPPQPKKRRGKGILIGCGVVLGILVFSLVICGIIGAHSQSSSSDATDITDQATPTQAGSTSQAVKHLPTQVPANTPKPAYELATIDNGGNPPDDATVAKYQALLDTLHSKTGDSEQSIADETVKGQQILHDKGKAISLYDLMDNTNNAIPDGTKTTYAEALAALITIMEQQQ